MTILTIVQTQKLDLLKIKVENKIKELQKLSKTLWKVSPEMTISYELKSSRVLGQAEYSRKQMTLNKFLLVEFGEDYINEVVVHEYAHFVVDNLVETGRFSWNTKPHGREFKSVCSHFGIVGKSTTNLFSASKYLGAKRASSNRRYFEYTCGCMTHKVTANKHNKMTRGNRYLCNTCKTSLTFKKALQ